MTRIRDERARHSGAAATERERLEDARAEAGHHARVAAAEGLLVLRALLDVASLAGLGRAAGDVASLRSTAELLEQMAAGLRPEGDPARDLLRELGDALAVEIDRWEARGRDDPEARAVYRAFSGLRDVLGELGVVPDAPHSRSAPRRATA